MTTQNQTSTHSKVEDLKLYTDLQLILSEDEWKVNWEKPIEFDQIKPMEMPLAAFPNVIKNMIFTVTNTLETPNDLQAMFSLGVMATALQSKLIVNPWGSWCEVVCLYTASFLGASTRKSASFDAMTKPIIEFQRTLQLEVKKQKKDNENKIKVLNKKASALEKKYLETLNEKDFLKLDKLLKEIEKYQVKEMPLLIVDDLTEESLIQKMSVNNEKMAILSSEGNLLDRVKSSKFEVSKLSVYLKSYSKDHISVIRIMRDGETLYNPHLTISIAAQPAVLEDFPQALVSRGFLPRFLLSVPYDSTGWREGGIRDGYDENIVKHYHDIITKLMAFEPKEPIKLTYSAAAQQRLVEYERQHEALYRGDNVFSGELREWGGKFIGQLVRISGLFHFVNEVENNPDTPFEELNTVIEEDLITKILSMVNYFIQHTQIAYGIVNINQELLDAEYLFKKILLVEFNNLALHNDIWQKVKHRFSTRKELDKLLQILIDRHYIKPVSVPAKNNRGKKEAYIINPLTFITQHTKH